MSTQCQKEDPEFGQRLGGSDAKAFGYRATGPYESRKERLEEKDKKNTSKKSVEAVGKK